MFPRIPPPVIFGPPSSPTPRARLRVGSAFVTTQPMRADALRGIAVFAFFHLTSCFHRLRTPATWSVGGPDLALDNK